MTPHPPAVLMLRMTGVRADSSTASHGSRAANERAAGDGKKNNNSSHNRSTTASDKQCRFDICLRSTVALEISHSSFSLIHRHRPLSVIKVSDTT